MASKQGQDPYVQRGKQLASSVQKLRGWVGSDSSRTPELADALVELTAHRLIGHAHAEAAADAQESAAMAGKLLTEDGPLGPYTPVAAAARYLSAGVHLATIQSGVGLPEAADRTLRAALELRDQLPELDLATGLDPRTAIWALAGVARASLASNDLEAANAYADAAFLRLVESGLATAPESAYLSMDVERLVGDCRWAAGWSPEAVDHAERARSIFDAEVDGRLGRAGGLSPALLARLREPLVGVYSDLADRLVATGDLDRGLVARRTLIELLRGLRKPAPDSVADLGSVLSDLAEDLRGAGRAEEAEAAAAEAGELGASVRERLSAGQRLPGWAALDDGAAFASATGSGETHRSVRELEAAAHREAETRAAAERAEAHRLEQERERAAHEEAERREDERVAAERELAARAESARLAAEQAEAERLEAARLESERAVAAEEAERLEVKRRREERLEAHRLELERQEAHRAETERLAVERRLAEQDPAEAERQELERLQAELAELERQEQAETERLESERAAQAERAARAELDRIEAERVEAERVEAERVEAERAEAERAAQAELERVEAERVEAERVEAERVEQERVEQERAEQERAEQERAKQERVEQERVEQERAQQAEQTAPAAVADDAPAVESEDLELTQARRSWEVAKLSGDRKALRAATEQASDLLRPRAERDPSTYGPELIDALQQLSSARLRGGDIFGSRAPAREAKALAKAWGH